MKTIYIAAVALLGFAGSLCAQDAATDKVAETLKGKLMAAKDGEVADAELAGAPEFYVLYHSASW